MERKEWSVEEISKMLEKADVFIDDPGIKRTFTELENKVKKLQIKEIITIISKMVDRFVVLENKIIYTKERVVANTEDYFADILQKKNTKKIQKTEYYDRKEGVKNILKFIRLCKKQINKLLFEVSEFEEYEGITINSHVYIFYKENKEVEENEENQDR